MSDQAKLKESVKKSIRGLVGSAPLGLTPEEVALDYESFEGRPLPFRQLGYNTCQDFLQDIPDTVRPCWERGQLIVRVVEGESTRHIHSLVSRQKVDVLKCLKKRRGAARAGARTLLTDANAPGRPAGGIALNTRPNTRGPPALSPSVSAYLRNQIKSLLIAHPNGVLNVHFDRLFAEKYGHTISFKKLGFESLAHMCQSMPDFVTLERLRGDEFRIYEKSNHPAVNEPTSDTVSSSTQRTRANKTEHVQRDNVDSSLPDSRKAPLASCSFEDDENFKQKSASNVPRPSNATSHSSTMSKNAGYANSTEQPGRLTEPQSAQRTRPQVTKSSNASQDVSKDVNASSEDGSLTSELFDTKFLQQIRQILERHPEGLWAAYLPDEYKKKYKKALPMMSLGYFSVTELMAAMPEVVAVEREQKQGDWKLYDVRTYKPKTVESAKSKASSSDQNVKANKKLNPNPTQGFQDLKDKVRQLLEKNPEGILLKNLAFYYQRMFGLSFPVDELGFRDVESLIMMMPDTATLVYKGYGRLLVMLVEEMPVDSLNIGDEKLSRLSIPADSVGWGFSYSYCEYPPIQDYIEVYVATVFTPHRLSIQLKDKLRNDALDDLMDELESIYSYPEGNKYEFPECMIAVGQVCCALYLSDNNWHRAVITGIPKVDFLEVLYVDYGTVATVSRSSLRLLKSCFLKLPIQAYNARLAFIAPSEDKWTMKARDRLLAMTAGKPLIALITEIQNDELYLLLSDTTTEEDIHINDALVEEGLAVFARTQDDLDQLLPPPLEGDVPQPDLAMLTLEDVTEFDENASDDQRELLDMTQEQEESPLAPEDGAEVDVPLPDGGSNPPSEDKSRDLPPLEAIADEAPWIVKRIDFHDGYQVHLINHDSDACLTVVEVADLMCGEDESEPEDILYQQVDNLGVEIPLLTAVEKESPRLFEELRSFDLLDDSEDFILMMPFTSAMLLLSSCSSVRMDTVQQLQEIAENFGVFGDLVGSDIDESAKDELDLSLDVEELNMTLSALQFRRKRILGDMMVSHDSNGVDHLSYIERKIEEISQKLEATKSHMQQQEVAGRQNGFFDQLGTPSQGTRTV
ncbi:tudor domain-containing protein 5-like isoform X2 [Acanthaster planci]|uniref:Tudor domain-containing protein 5-like isoform X2 n=1 Tax=Acanthaster planci TaxID=133434 RepID=A0A8B7XYM6_ACAPL|nr:tudor domain-containing protein 5-like isoform X2 [Acanthaster planci]